jgi:hypothetical protein
MQVKILFLANIAVIVAFCARLIIMQLRNVAACSNVPTETFYCNTMVRCNKHDSVDKRAEQNKLVHASLSWLIISLNLFTV